METCYYCIRSPASKCTCININLCEVHYYLQEQISLRAKPVNYYDFYNIKQLSQVFPITDRQKLCLIKDPQTQLSEVISLLKKTRNISLTSNEAFIHSISASKENNYIAGILKNNTIKLWRYSSDFELSVVSEINEEKNDSLSSSKLIVISSRNNFVAYPKSYSGLSLWYYNEGKVVRLEQHVAYLLKLTRREDYLVILGNSNFTVMDCITYEIKRKVDISYTNFDSDFDGTDKMYFMSSLRDNSISCYDIYRSEGDFKLNNPYNLISALKVNYKGDLLATAHEQNKLVLWKIESRQVLVVFGNHLMAVKVLLFTENTNELISGGLDKFLLIWDLTNFCLKRKVDFEILVSKPQLINDTMMAVPTFDNNLIFFDFNKEERISNTQGHNDRITFITFSQSLNYIASGGHDRSIISFNLDTNKSAKGINCHNGCISVLCFTQNGEFLLSGSVDSYIKFWEKETMQLLRSLEVQRGRIIQIFITPDNKTMTLSSDNMTLQVWDLDRVQCETNVDMDDYYMKIKFISKNRTYVIMVQDDSHFYIMKLRKINNS